jgi:hypothetical protein
MTTMPRDYLVKALVSRVNGVPVTDVFLVTGRQENGWPSGRPLRGPFEKVEWAYRAALGVG